MLTLHLVRCLAFRMEMFSCLSEDKCDQSRESVMIASANLRSKIACPTADVGNAGSTLTLGVRTEPVLQTLGESAAFRKRDVVTMELLGGFSIHSPPLQKKGAQSRLRRTCASGPIRVSSRSIVIKRWRTRLASPAIGFLKGIEAFSDAEAAVLIESSKEPDAVGKGRLKLRVSEKVFGVLHANLGQRRPRDCLVMIPGKLGGLASPRR